MTLEIKQEGESKRRLRLGMVGGGPGGFIGAVHRIAARLDDRFELVAAALSSDPERARSAALDLHIAPDRAYRSFTEMAAAEAGRKDRIDAVAIVTPNHLHYLPAKTFLEAGIHVICDKPLTTTLEDALDLAQIVRRTGLLFAVTHNYTGHPMVRQARQMIADGELGPIRLVHVEYAQDWLATPLEQTGQKQAAWRTDPAQSGPAGSLGDIGTHAYNLASFVTGLSCRELAAELHTFVPGRRLDDNVQIMLRFTQGARGMLWASQVATGNRNNLRLRVYGEKAGLEWRQEDPDYLWFALLGKAPISIYRGGPAATAVAAHASRVPAGHPEGYLEAFAQLYTDMAEQISARLEGRPPNPASLLVPTVDDGVAGVRFISAVLESSRRNAAWTPLPGGS
ncbi:MAG TPA: Gfo/Idh/MocA family oxidoreductase [Terriglobales bacterium]|nr:Gfo/Idh/MocA family oxidoreductase [Terriglobales bacterium]